MWNFPLEATPILTPTEIVDVDHNERTVDGMTNIGGEVNSDDNAEQNEILFDTNGDLNVLNVEGTLEIIDGTQVGVNALPSICLEKGPLLKFYSGCP